MINSDEASARWLTVPAPLLSKDGVVYLPEAPGTDVGSIVRALLDGAYDRPFVVDDGQLRRLHFSLDFVQSEMRLDNPDELSFPYTREMMAALLFCPKPRHIVLVGLGGGSLTKFCHRQLPKTRLTTLEIDPDVIAFRDLFAIPEDGPGSQLLQIDALDYFSGDGDVADIVFVDACDRYGVANAVAQEAFYFGVRNRLSRNGLMVVNLVGSDRDIHRHVRLVAGTFSGRVLLQEMRVGGNHLLFAFSNPKYAPHWPALQRTAGTLADRHGLNFALFLKNLRRSEQFQAMALD